MKTLITKKIYLLLAIVLLISPACEDFLDMPKKGRLSQDEFYENDDYATMSIYAVYDLLQDLYGAWWNNLMMTVTIPTDEVNAGGGSASDQPQFQELSGFTYDAGNGNIAGTYGTLYSVINRCNVVLANLSDDSDKKKRAKADAKCIRAYCYFQLVTLWQNVPLVLTVLEAGEQPSQATPTAIWAQIEQDLNEAIIDLPSKSAVNFTEPWRVSKETAQVLLGKALVFQEKYSAAITPLQAVITDGNYSLSGDYASVLRINQEFGEESLFEVSFDGDYLESDGDFTWGNTRTQETNISWQLSGPRDVEMGSSGIAPGWGFMTPRQEAWDAFINANDVNRRNARIMSDDELIALGGRFLRVDDENLDDGTVVPGTGDYIAYNCEGFVRLAYTSYESEAGGSSWSYGTNVRLLRYADCLLLAAEAYAETGDNGNAELYLNMVRTRVNLPDYDAGTDGTLTDVIQSERQREFMFEGHRWQDVIRKGQGATVFGSLGFVAGKHELFPIPQTAIDANANLKQNPGW